MSVKAADAKRVSGLLAALDEVRDWLRLFREKTAEGYRYVRLDEIVMCETHDSSEFHPFHGEFALPREIAIYWFEDLYVRLTAELKLLGVETE